jgi:hypothetical protein
MKTRGKAAGEDGGWVAGSIARTFETDRLQRAAALVRPAIEPGTNCGAGAHFFIVPEAHPGRKLVKRCKNCGLDRLVPTRTLIVTPPLPTPPRRGRRL